MSKAKQIITQFRKTMNKREEEQDPNVEQTRERNLATQKNIMKAIGEASVLGNKLEKCLREGSDYSECVGKMRERLDKANTELQTLDEKDY